MDFKAFKESLEKPRPLYLLKADREFLVRKVYDLCKAQVSEESRPFDWGVFDLETDSAATVVDSARVLPWLSARRWVWVKNAHAGSQGLTSYLQDPSQKTTMIVVFRSKPSDWPGIPEITPESLDAVDWVLEKAEAEGYKIERSVARALAELLDEDFQLIEANLEKLFLLRHEEKTIDQQAVSEMVCQVPEDNIFELIGAIAAQRGNRAIHLLHDLFEAGSSAQQIVSMLHWNFRRLLVARELVDRRVPFFQILSELKIWSYRGKEREIRKTSKRHLAQVLLRLRETDRISKTTSTNERELLQRLVIDTCQSESI